MREGLDERDHGPDQHHEHHGVPDLEPRVELGERSSQGLQKNLAVEETSGFGHTVRGSRVLWWRGCVCFDDSHQKNFPWLSCSTMGPSETAGKKVRPPTMMITPTSNPMNMGLSVRKVPAPSATTFFAARIPPSAMAG